MLLSIIGFIAPTPSRGEEVQTGELSDYTLQYEAAMRKVKRIVKHDKNNKELSTPRICKHNPKSFYSYIYERRIQHRATQNSGRNCVHNRQ